LGEHKSNLPAPELHREDSIGNAAGEFQVSGGAAATDRDDRERNNTDEVTISPPGSEQCSAIEIGREIWG
jgi:hypothetical protein